MARVLTAPRVPRGVLGALAGTALVAVVCNAVLEVSQIVASGSRPWQFKSPAYPLMFLLGTLAVWLLVLAVHAVVGRLRVTVAVVAVATCVLVAVNAEKLRLRQEPLLPTDAVYLGQWEFLLGMTGPRVLLAFGLTLLASALTVIVGTRWWQGRRPPPEPERARTPLTRGSAPLRVAGRVTTLLCCLAVLVSLGGFNTPGNLGRAAYDELGAEWKPWSQRRNYLGNGFVGGLLYNLDVPRVAPPPGYTRSAMDDLVARYTTTAERINRHRDPEGLRDLNVVMVLSESFSDPTAVEALGLRRDPIPRVRRLLAGQTSGSMLASSIGGGTANMEFETLTGLSASQFPPQLDVPYQHVVAGNVSFPSVVRWMEQQGHTSLALHPFTPEMYRRDEVYRALGFDRFLHEADLPAAERLGNDGYVSDAAAFGRVVREVDRERRPLFANLVTMQNHMPYEDRYDDPVRVTGPDGEQLDGVGSYLRGISHTDRAVTGLLSGLGRLDEPTAVVFYGDHLPGVYPPSVLDSVPPAARLQTPFFVWASFGEPGGRVPVTSPTHFVDLLLERADAPVAPYYALQQRLRERLPALGAGMLFDERGRRVTRAALDDRDRRLLRDYRLVHYDLSFGHRWSEFGLLGRPPTPAG